MTAPDPPKVSAKDATLSLLAKDIMAGSAASIEAPAMTQAQADKIAADKARLSNAWLKRAGACMVVALLILSAGVFVLTKMAMAEAGLPVLIFLGIAFAVVGGLVVCVALYCAAQSSTEFLNTFLAMLFKINRQARKPKEE